MSADDRLRWDAIFQQRRTKPFPAPDPLLLQYTPAITKADAPTEARPRALDLAAGVGQNGLWLAEQGYAVDIMDISRVALQRARQEMAIRNLRNANLLQVDIDELRLDDETYHLVCVFRYLQRSAFALLKRATKRGGRIIYETFNEKYLEQVPDFNPAFLLEQGELQRQFMDWRLLFWEEDAHISRLVAVKP